MASQEELLIVLIKMDLLSKLLYGINMITFKLYKDRHISFEKCKPNCITIR